jgi:hypothetical protein
MSGARYTVNMVHIGVDEDGFSEAFNKILSEGVDAMAEEIEWRWRQKASSTLKTSREEYLKGISVEVHNGTIQCNLDGWLPVAVETGCEQFDMKPGLLAGRIFRNIPMNKPFTHFKRLSTFSKGWNFPGLQARGILKQVEDELEEITEKSLDHLFRTTI